MTHRFGAGYTLTTKVQPPEGAAAPDTSAVEQFVKQKFENAVLLDAHHVCSDGVLRVLAFVGCVVWSLSLSLSLSLSQSPNLSISLMTWECGTGERLTKRTQSCFAATDCVRSPGGHQAAKMSTRWTLFTSSLLDDRLVT